MTQVKKETTGPVKPTDESNVTPTPEVKGDATETKYEAPESKDEANVKNGVLNGGKDDWEGNPVAGINAESSKVNMDIQEKAEASIKNGSASLDPTSIAEVQNGLVKDYNSDRGVYPTAKAASAALKASGKL